SRVQRLAGPAGGQGPFVPVGSTNRDKRGAFCPGWWFKPGQKARVAFCPGGSHQAGQKDPLLSRLVSPTGTKGLGPLIPFPLPPPEPFSSLVFLLFLARDRGVLAHFFTIFVKIFDSPSIHRR